MVTRLTLDIAAPMKLALAPLLHGGLMRVVTSTTTHEVTPISRGRSPVTDSSFGAPGPRQLIRHAVVRRFINVDQVLCGW